MITQLQWWRQNAEPCYCSDRVREPVEASEHARGCMRWGGHMTPSCSSADHSIPARVYGQLWARHYLLLLFLPVVLFHFLLFTTLLLLLLPLPLVILPHPLRLLLLRHLLSLLLQRPLWRQRSFRCWRLCLVVGPCSVVQLVRLQVVTV